MPRKGGLRMASAGMQHSAFNHDQFIARAKVFDIAPKFHFYDMQGNKIAFLKRKLFKLKEDIRLYADDSATRELLLIKARSILDFGATYDVTDATTQQKIGALRRKALKSMLRDEWEILDAAEAVIGRIREDHMVLALLRRFGLNFIPQEYEFEVGGALAGTAKQGWNPFVLRMHIDLTADSLRRLDRRLAAAAIVLLLAVEGRQD
jgi:uncharacterized protein YxjI